MGEVRSYSSVRGLTPNKASAISHARMCYDHLAGELGVAIANKLTQMGAIVHTGKVYEVTKKGAEMLRYIGVDVDYARTSRRTTATPCVDWTERRYHIGGALGATIAQKFIHEEWIILTPGSRAVELTSHGRESMITLLQVDL